MQKPVVHRVALLQADGYRYRSELWLEVSTRFWHCKVIQSGGKVVLLASFLGGKGKGPRKTPSFILVLHWRMTAVLKRGSQSRLAICVSLGEVDHTTRECM